LFELRVVGKHNIRLIYTFYEDDIYVLHGFVKKTQEIPKWELDTAQRKLQQLKKL
jgi:phage-related protein